MVEIKIQEYALLEDERNPSNTKYICEPMLFRLGMYILPLLFSSSTSSSFYIFLV